MTQPTSSQSPPTTRGVPRGVPRGVQWAPDEALEKIAPPPAPYQSNDSLEEISSPRQNRREEAVPNQEGLWHWLKQNLPDCFMAILRWISSLFTTEEPASVELQRVPQQPTVSSAADQLSLAFRGARRHWPQKQDAAKFNGCLAITVVKLTFSQEEPKIFWLEKSYTRVTREKYTNDMVEFSSSLPTESLNTFELCAVRCFPPLHRIEHVEATAFSFDPTSKKPTQNFVSTLTSAESRQDLYSMLPILQKAGVTLDDLAYRVTE